MDAFSQTFHKGHVSEPLSMIMDGLALGGMVLN